MYAWASMYSWHYQITKIDAAQHGACELKISDELNNSAQRWAEELLTKTQLENSPTSNRGEVGENISARSNPGKFTDISGVTCLTKSIRVQCVDCVVPIHSGKEVTDQWYSDSEKYNYDTAEGDAGEYQLLHMNAYFAPMRN